MWLLFHRISEWLWHQGTSCGLLNVNADARWTQLPADTHCPGSDPHPATCSLQTSYHTTTGKAREQKGGTFLQEERKSTGINWEFRVYGFSWTVW